MNLHQVLTGAVNAGDHCFAVGSVEGIAFTAYAAGCNIAILASNFERVQIIPGICNGNVQVGCIDCSTDRGKIAAAYASQVLIYEPTPLVHHNSSHKLDYCWVKTGAFRADCLVRNLSWNLEGTRLLTGGDCIHMWHHNVGPDPGVSGDGQVQFQIGGDETIYEERPAWQCIWKCKTAHPVYHLKFSPDGTLFASAGKADRLVKVWYENRTVRFPAKSFDIGGSLSSLSSTAKEDTNFAFIYVAHPRAVTGISWRKTSKYMPKVSVANMLVTSCKDNICRIWVQTVLPDDGLINLQQFDPMAAQNPKYRMHRHKHKFMVRLKHMKTCFHFRRRHANQGNGPLGEPIPSLPSTFSAHDFHSFGLHGVSITPGFHFHLAASINAETDIPLVPSISGRCDNREPNFVLHWLNNKEMHFTLCAEQILQELCCKAILQENVQNQNEDPDLEDGENGNDADADDDGVKEPEHKKKSSKKAKLRGIGNFVIRSKSAEESDPDRSYHSPASNPSTNSTASSSSISTDLSMGATTPLGDALDRKIDALLRDWHHSPDLLFSVHPVDGSYLVWLVDWLDEYSPSSFRQAQVSFSSRIPNALPLGDAVSMSPSLALYNCRTYLDLRDMLHLGEEGERESHEENNKDKSQLPPSTPPPMSDSEKRLTPPAPVICMLSKHSNGSLNLWHVMFNEDTRFSQVLSVSHQARVCGHRFRVNDITCHPVLPLLLTTSHHNLLRLHAQSPLLEDPNRIPEEEPEGLFMPEQFQHPSQETKADSTYGLEALQSGFCSELILWRVDPVGPLCKSGGVTELARINSPEVSAFANVAWIPTLLPSTTLGSISNSPSACFVASDGQSLRVYQAVIDARTLLAEVFAAQRKNNIDESLVSLSSSSSVGEGLKREALKENFSIVSQQSTSRPGCIIQLGAIADATHDWQNTQLLHVFQEQLITGERSPEEKEREEDDNPLLMQPSMGAIVDLHQSSIFKEPFFLVVLEKDAIGRTVLHMWKIVIASQPGREEDYNGMAFAPDSNIVQDSDHSTASSPSNNTGDMAANAGHQHVAPVSMTTTKVCTQVLPLPDKVEIIHSCPAAGHLSSSSIYPACFAPYLISTACSDSMVRFWRCKTNTSNSDPKSPKQTYEWVEWEMMNNRNGSSAIEIQGKPLNVSCAYSGRIACAYKLGRSFTRPTSNNPNSRYVNLCIGIYECELTGGSGWVREDTIHLKNISLPDMGFEMDMRYVHDSSLMVRKKQSINNLVRTLSHEDVVMSGLPRDGDVSMAADHICPNLQGLVAVPSFSTLQTLRKTIWEKGNRFPLTQKHLVQLDWVSTEDGSHMLTVGVGSKILLFTAVGGNVAQSNLKAMQESKNASRPLLKKASSMAAPLYKAEEVKWMKVRSLSLTTADGLPPLPMQLSWVRDGICVVGMDNEMHVYSQWKPTEQGSFRSRRRSHCDFEDSIDDRTLTEKDLIQLAHESSQRRLAHVRSLNHISSANLVGGVDAKKKRELISKSGMGMNDTNAGSDVMFDYGLFEASRIACPVLPQYHPKQLMELLNFGKIRRVKAILCHLVRCLAGSSAMDPLESRTRLESNTGSAGGRSWSRSRTLSISVPTRTSPGDAQQAAPPPVVPEELQLDYMEINAIPSLPLSTLLAADREVLVPNDADAAEGYSGLFDSVKVEEGDVLDDILSEDAGGMTHSHERRRSFSNDNYSLACFGPRQTKILTKLLTHTHLPGLSSLDQMYLLALAETVATFNTEFSDKFSLDSTKRSSTLKHGSIKMKGASDTDVATDLLDDCGLRFLLAMRHRAFLMRCLPMAQRAQLQKQGLPSANLVWAFHSEAQEELINMIPSMQKNAPRWSDLRELGVGWWASSNATLRRCLEKVAKTAFHVRNDPLDAALYYLAMRKKNIVWGLFRSVQDNRMTAFFQNDFSDHRWRQAALKNAFALLGKQRFYHAAAFFLLAGSLPDAVEVCLTKLDDLQLAMVLVRLYEGDMDPMPVGLQRLLFREILGCDPDGSNHDPANAHPDPFLRSVAFWQLKDYPNALGTLLQSNVGSNHPKMREDDSRSQTGNPNVFNFYLYLRTHPLVLRRQIAASVKERKISRVMLSGFSHNSETKPIIVDKQLVVEDAITPLERRLYFATAHMHFKGGCPLLALEVLSKLPGKVLDEDSDEDRIALKISPTKPMQDTPLGGNTPIDTGIINDAFISSPTGEFDWSQPVGVTQLEETLDLSRHGGADDDDDDDEDSSKDEINKEGGDTFEEKKVSHNRKISTGESGNQKLDIMAQQLKFIACLKIMMEELSTLATGFEVDGGQLRYQLYVWLEQEVDALREICNYGGVDIFTQREVHDRDKDASGRLTPTVAWRPGDKPTLHEILLSDKYDFEAKLERAERRRRWLRANQTLLRTLLSYCSLHGASGGGLASVHMELILLLQELHQEKTQRQLLSPLPFPTTLPLLSASVACHKTVVTDPIRHLQSMTHDILHSVVELPSPPVPGRVNLGPVFVFRDLSIALSACIYQTLCDSDSFSVGRGGYMSAGMEALASTSVIYHDSHLMASHRRHRFSSCEEPLEPTTAPNKWPGVTSLRALLAREKDEDVPKLTVLLCETFVAVYMSLLVHAMATCEAHTLYRLVGQRFTEKTWAVLFGGGAKRLLKVAVPKAAKTAAPGSPTSGGSFSETGLFNTLSKQRMKLHMKILGPSLVQGAQPAAIKEDRPTYREQFVPPDQSMVSCFMTKPQLPSDYYDIDYDSSESIPSEEEEEESEDDEDDFTKERVPVENCTEHSDPNSYSWSILRYAVVRLVQHHLQTFLNVAGMELQELPVASPLIHSTLRVLDNWLNVLKDSVDSFCGVPEDLIPGCVPDRGHAVPAIQKYRAILEPHNTPFKSKHWSTYPVRRLWLYLVHQESVQEIFIRYVFGKKKSTPIAKDVGAIVEDVDSNDAALPDPIRIIHKDQDSISAFCMNKTGTSIMALATTKEVQELDISVLLEPPSWLECECEYDLLNLRGADSLPAADYLVVQTAADRPMLAQMNMVPSHASSAASSTLSSPSGTGPSHFTGQTGRATTVLKGINVPGATNPQFCQLIIDRSRHLLTPLMKHRVEGVRRMSAHPLLPIYLSGSQDGCVRIWEWGHNQPLATPRPPGTYAKVTRVLFNPQGNKFGVSDGDGNLSLWQLGLSSSTNKAFFSMQCHTKQTSDFVFVGSSSLLATAGHSSESKNVCLWDTLLPQKKALIHSFACHEQGSSCVLYAPQHQVLISSGKKGFVCIFDVRQRQLRHRFQAHEGAVKCMALDQAEEFFVTGSADGDIKVWGLTLNNVFFNFPGEHVRNTFFRNIGIGVSQLYVDTSNRLFSCGADGSMKLRQLPERELVVSSYYQM